MALAEVGRSQPRATKASLALAVVRHQSLDLIGVHEERIDGLGLEGVVGQGGPLLDAQQAEPVEVCGRDSTAGSPR